MSIKILYFARFRERLGVSEERIDPAAPGMVSVHTVLQQLMARGGQWAELFGTGGHVVLAAVNQQMVKHDHPLAAGDELALFPPVTGG